MSNMLRVPVAIMDKGNNTLFIAKSISHAATLLKLSPTVVQSILKNEVTHNKYNLRRVDPLELVRETLDMEGIDSKGIDMYNSVSDYSLELDGVL